MTDTTNAESVRCQDRVCPPPYFDDFACENRAKWLATGRGHTDLPVCGVHARWFRRHGEVRPIDGGER